MNSCAEGIPGNEQRHLHHRQQFQRGSALLHLDDKGVDGRRITIIAAANLVLAGPLAV